MQQTFSCPNCGTQNYIGEPSCRSCGQGFQYNCPYCSAIVDGTLLNCPNCRQPLNWPSQQQAQPQHIKQKVKRTSQGDYQQEKRKSPWLIGCLGLVVIGVFIGVIIAITSSSESPPSTSPPTAPTITASEQAYANTIADHSMRVGEAFNEFSNLMSNPQIGDEEWTIKAATQLVIIQALYDEAMEIDPPSSMAHIHYKYVQAMQHYDTATDLIAEGIDTLNIDLINQAVAEIDLGNQLVSEATQLTNEFLATHSQ